VGLRLFCFALIHVAPVLLAPYWVHFCDKQRHSELPVKCPPPSPPRNPAIPASRFYSLLMATNCFAQKPSQR
jgi:hypothetical protein